MGFLHRKRSGADSRKTEWENNCGADAGQADASAPAKIGVGGVSVEAFLEQFDRDLAPDETITSSVANAAAVEIVTNHDYPGAGLAMEDEAEQFLSLSKGGVAVLRSVKYYKGKGHYGIGRYEKVNIPASSVMEIFHMLDTWLFMEDPELWSAQADHGSWTIRVSRGEGHAQMMRGALNGASVDGIDLSEFIRQRIPIPDLFLFDPEPKRSSTFPDASETK